MKLRAEKWSIFIQTQKLVRERSAYETKEELGKNNFFIRYKNYQFKEIAIL